MIRKKELNFALNIIFVVAGVFVFLWCIKNVDIAIAFAKDYPVVAPFLIVLWRVIGVVIPPIPGGIVSLALIPVFGWFASFIYSSIGILIGTTLSFFLAKRYGTALVSRFIPTEKINKWVDRYSENTKFFAFLFIRFTTGPVLDFISYIAGLTKISYTTFIVATFISLLPNAIYYYLGDNIYKQTTPVAIGLILFVVIAYYFSTKVKALDSAAKQGKLARIAKRIFGAGKV